MKKQLLYTIAISVLFLTACGGNGTETPPAEAPAEDPVEQPAEENEGDMGSETNDENREEAAGQAHGEEITEFQLEIDLSSQDDYIDIDFEVERDQNEAEYIVGDERLNGSDAEARITDMFNQLAITPSSSEDEIIDDLLAYLEVDRSEVTDFDFEIEFNDQEKIEIDRNQL